jgi:hypothetical protein
VRLTPHFIRVHDLLLGFIFSIVFPFHSFDYILTTMWVFDCSLVGVSLFFYRKCVVAYKFGGIICPTSTHFGNLVLLIIFFSSVHTLGTMYDSSLWVWKNIVQYCCYVNLKHVFEL